MVAEGGPGQDGGNPHQHQAGIQGGHEGHDNGNHDPHGSPGGTGGKGDQGGNDKDGSGHSPEGEVPFHDAGHIGAGTQFTGDAANGPGQKEDADGNDHGLEALDQGIHGFGDAQDTPGRIENYCNQDGKHACIAQGGGGIGIPDGFKEAHAAVKVASGVGKADDGSDDHGEDGYDQVDGRTPVSDLQVVEIIAGRGTLGGIIEDARFQGPPLGSGHGAVFQAGEAGEQHHDYGQPGIEIQGYHGQEGLEGVHIKAHFGKMGPDEGHDVGDPAGEGYEHTDGGSCGVDDIGQLLPGDPVVVGHGPHDGSHGEAVEVVIEENGHTQEPGGKNGAGPAGHPLGSPMAEGSGSAGAGKEAHQTPQEHEEEDQGGVPAGVAQVFKEHIHQGKKGVEGIIAGQDHGTGKDTQKQGDENLLGNYGQNNGNKGR